MSDSLKFKILPATLINKNFVQGNQNSNYEKYLLEFINSSDFFLKKSKGQKYKSPVTEDKGECDCISDNYKLDFKMLISKTMAQAKNLFTQSIYQLCQGVTMYGDAKVKPSNKIYHPIEAAVLHTWLRDLSVDELYQISLSDNFSIPAYKDIKSILAAVNRPKNILCMLPYEYVDNNSLNENNVLERVSHDYRSLLEFRMKVQPNYDNFIAFIFKDNLIIMQYSDEKVMIADRIPLYKSKIFQELNDISKTF